jgi:hypothetical protein
VPQLSDTRHVRLRTAIDVNDDHFVDLIVGRTREQQLQDPSAGLGLARRFRRRRTFTAAQTVEVE